MSDQNKIKILISSRNNAKFDGKELSYIRSTIKEMIESSKLFGFKGFDVWINEKEFPQAFDQTIWDKCLKEIKQADIVLALFNGESGWLQETETIGICHAELKVALDSAPGKVTGIRLGDFKEFNGDSKSHVANRKFQEYIDAKKEFSQRANDYGDLLTKVNEALYESVVSLAKKGVLFSSSSKGNFGQSLDWKRLNYHDRSNVIIKELQKTIVDSTKGFNIKENYFLSVDDRNILLKITAIPDAFSIAKAREIAGQPYLLEYQFSQILKNNDIGVVHIIGCHKTITETQARNTLGFPDALILKDNFGVYVADNVQKIQMVFLEKCSDSTSTQMQFQSFLTWLFSTNEKDEFIRRAESRKKIITVINNEMKFF